MNGEFRVGNGDASRFQEVGMDYVDDGSVPIIHASASGTGMTLHEHYGSALFTLSHAASTKPRYRTSADQPHQHADDSESNQDDNNTVRHPYNSSERASPFFSPPSTAGGSASGLSNSDFGDYFMLEPDLQMSRANWWQDLVTIYHPNAEIGTKLVMDDILHLCVSRFSRCVFHGRY